MLPHQYKCPPNKASCNMSDRREKKQQLISIIVRTDESKTTDQKIRRNKTILTPFRLWHIVVVYSFVHSVLLFFALVYVLHTNIYYFLLLLIVFLDLNDLLFTTSVFLATIIQTLYICVIYEHLEAFCIQLQRCQNGGSLFKYTHRQFFYMLVRSFISICQHLSNIFKRDRSPRKEDFNKKKIGICKSNGRILVVTN